MAKLSIGLIAGMAGLIALTTNLQSQGIIDKSLGDAAREQRELHNSTESEKTYGNEDVEPAGSGGRWKSREASVAKPSSSVSQPSTLRLETPGAEGGRPERLPGRSVLDHCTDAEELDAEDSLIVPGGTQLRIEIPAVTEPPVPFYAAQLVAPVRIGFATAIPALSVATVQVVTRHYPRYGARSSARYSLGYFEALEVSQVVVEGVAYTVQTDQIARPWRVRSPSELTFKLLKPLTIER